MLDLCFIEHILFFFVFIGSKCRKAYSFTRVPQYEYIGEANEELRGVSSLAKCRNLCSTTSLYQCRSATYYANSRICKLSEETRRSAPSDFRPAERGVVYLENECSDGELTDLPLIIHGISQMCE